MPGLSYTSHHPNHLSHFGFSGLARAVHVGGPSYHSNMRSIDGDRLNDILDVVEAVYCEPAYDVLTAAEWVALAQRYRFLLGRLDVLTYELTSPFVLPHGNVRRERRA